MEAENTPATPETEELDRREILAQQFEAAEQGEDVQRAAGGINRKIFRSDVLGWLGPGR